jgi:hypothetical protein
MMPIACLELDHRAGMGCRLRAAMDTERSFARLSSRLGFASVGYRAEGSFEDTTVTLKDVDRSRTLAMSCALLRPMDLGLSLALGDCAPRAITEAHKRTGDPELDGWISIWGKGEVDRAARLLTPRLRTELRRLTGSLGVRVTDLLLEAHVAASTPVDEQERVLRELLALRAVIDEATREVPVCIELRPAWPSFERFAGELGVEARSSAFGLQGRVDGCIVDVFRFLPAGGTLLIHVDFPTPLSGDVLLNSHLGRSLRPRIRSLFSTLLALGPQPGWFALGSRFKTTRGTLRDVKRSFGELSELAKVARDEHAFLNVSSERLITGVRVRDPHNPPDLTQRIRKLVAAAKRIHGVAPRRVDGTAGGPSR